MLELLNKLLFYDEVVSLLGLLCVRGLVLMISFVQTRTEQLRDAIYDQKHDSKSIDASNDGEKISGNPT